MTTFSNEVIPFPLYKTLIDECLYSQHVLNISLDLHRNHCDSARPFVHIRIAELNMIVLDSILT